MSYNIRVDHSPHPFTCFSSQRECLICDVEPMEVDNPISTLKDEIISIYRTNETEPMEVDSVIHAINNFRQESDMCDGNIVDFNFAKYCCALNPIAIKRSHFIIIFDTSALIQDPSVLLACFASDQIFTIIPYTVIRELDGLKKSHDERISFSAKRVISIIQNEIVNTGLNDHLVLESSFEALEKVDGLICEKNDDFILKCAYTAHERYDQLANVYFATNDKNLFVKAAALRISVKDHREILNLAECIAPADYRCVGLQEERITFESLHGKNYKTMGCNLRPLRRLNDDMADSFIHREDSPHNNETFAEILEKFDVDCIKSLPLASELRPSQNSNDAEGSLNIRLWKKAQSDTVGRTISSLQNHNGTIRLNERPSTSREHSLKKFIPRSFQSDERTKRKMNTNYVGTSEKNTKQRTLNYSNSFFGFQLAISNLITCINRKNDNEAVRKKAELDTKRLNTSLQDALDGTFYAWCKLVDLVTTLLALYFDQDVFNEKTKIKFDKRKIHEEYLMDATTSSLQLINLQANLKLVK